MTTLKWKNRFLAALIALIVVFVAVVGWIVIRENTITSAASDISPPRINAVSTNTPAPPPAYAPSRAPASTKQMYARMQSSSAAAPLSAKPSADQNYNVGYTWASDQKISSAEQCRILSTEYISGCHAYLEVKNYINQAEVNPNAPRY